MNKIIGGIGIAIIFTFIGYYVKTIEQHMQPNYRWVQIYNKTNCELTSASVVFPDRSVKVAVEQLDQSEFPYNESSDINIPILVSESSEYHVEISFEGCPKRIGDSRKITSGSIIEVLVDKKSFEYRAR